MTADEMNKVIEIMLEADGGCSNCASALLDSLRTAFPESSKRIESAFFANFRKKLSWP